MTNFTKYFDTNNNNFQYDRNIIFISSFDSTYITSVVNRQYSYVNYLNRLETMVLIHNILANTSDTTAATKFKTIVPNFLNMKLFLSNITMSLFIMASISSMISVFDSVSDLVRNSDPKENTTLIVLHAMVITACFLFQSYIQIKGINPFMLTLNCLFIGFVQLLDLCFNIYAVSTDGPLHSATVFSMVSDVVTICLIILIIINYNKIVDAYLIIQFINKTIKLDIDIQNGKVNNADYIESLLQGKSNNYFTRIYCK